MKTKIHHAAVNVCELDWYAGFFQDVFGMTVERTAGEAPSRQIWFREGIQLIEKAEGGKAGGQTVLAHEGCDHISLGVDEDPVCMAKRAVDRGGKPVEGKGEHWFSLPNGVQIELKPYRE